MTEEIKKEAQLQSAHCHGSTFHLVKYLNQATKAPTQSTPETDQVKQLQTVSLSRC